MEKDNTNTAMETFLVKTEEGIRKLMLTNLISVLGKNNQLAFFLTGEMLITEGSFADIRVLLPIYFMQVNPNTLINLHYVQKIDILHRKVVMANKSSYPVSLKKLATIYKLFGLKSGTPRILLDNPDLN